MDRLHGLLKGLETLSVGVEAFAGGETLELHAPTSRVSVPLRRCYPSSDDFIRATWDQGDVSVLGRQVALSGIIMALARRAGPPGEILSMGDPSPPVNVSKIGAISHRDQLAFIECWKVVGRSHCFLLCPLYHNGPAVACLQSPDSHRRRGLSRPRAASKRRPPQVGTTIAKSSDAVHTIMSWITQRLRRGPRRSCDPAWSQRWCPWPSPREPRTGCHRTWRHRRRQSRLR